MQCQYDGTNCHCYYSHMPENCTCTLYETMLQQIPPKENVIGVCETLSDALAIYCSQRIQCRCHVPVP